MKIVLSSELSTEEFEYSNRASADEGFERLMKSCQEHFKQDGLVRKLTLVVREETIGEEE